MKRIGITGASGFIGVALATALARRGDAVRVFSRNPQSTNFPSQIEVRQLDVMTADADSIAALFEGCDAVVHLAGETVAGRWTAQKKRQIHDSRQIGTRNLIAGLRACKQPPRTLVAASASGYYGSRADEPLTEDSPPGADFLARVCIDWEAEAQAARGLGIRVVCLRQGLVLGKHGGALKAMLAPFKLGIGGPLGSGAQWWPWIHLDDTVALYLFAIDRDDVAGAVNAVSPDVATNARVSQALGYALGRPALAPAPALGLRLLLGEFADSLLASQLMLPARAEDLGFVWQHESLDRALLDVLAAPSSRPPGTQHFEVTEKVASSPLETFQFFSDPANLEALTPPSLQLKIKTPLPVVMGRGTVIEYQLKVRGLPVHWKTLVTRWSEGRSFSDVQLRGPYLLWRHQHDFEPGHNGVIVRDSVDYALPLAPLSNPALPLVRADVQEIFDYRRRRLDSLLKGTSAP